MTESSGNQPEGKIKFISISKAGEDLGVNRTTVYNYIKRLHIEMHKFPLDRKAYITVEDVARIKEAKKAASEGQR